MPSADGPNGPTFLSQRGDFYVWHDRIGTGHPTPVLLGEIMPERGAMDSLDAIMARSSPAKPDRAKIKAAATLNKLLPPWRRLRLKIQGKIVMRGQSGLIWNLRAGSPEIIVNVAIDQRLHLCQSNSSDGLPWADWATGIYLRVKSGIQGEAEIIQTSGYGNGWDFRYLPKDIAVRLIPAPSRVSAWGRMRRFSRNIKRKCRYLAGFFIGHNYIHDYIR